MNFESWGLAGLVAVLYTARTWLQNIWGQISSMLVVHVSLDNVLLQRAVEDHIFSNFKASPLGRRSYDAVTPPLVQGEVVSRMMVMEVLGGDTRLFWRGWLPIWMTGASRSNGSTASVFGSQSPSNSPALKLTYLRYTVDMPKLIQTAVDARYGCVQRNTRRFQIHRRTGFGRAVGSSSLPVSPTAQRNPTDGWWTYSDLRGRVLGDTAFLDAAPSTILSDMWLCGAAQRILADFEYWLTSAKWFYGAGIRWRRNYALYGDPGTGKSTFVRFLAQQKDLPLYVIEINTMCDRELYSIMDEVRMDVPCIVLFEDVDNSFHGREKADPTLDCSFAAWQSALDGVKSADGIATFITTNKPEHLDPSVATWHPAEDDKPGWLECNRPGRVDVAAEMAHLTEAGRRQLVERYLPELDTREQLQFLSKFANCTAAVFQDACVQKAIQLHFKHGTTDYDDGGPTEEDLDPVRFELRRDAYVTTGDRR